MCSPAQSCKNRYILTYFAVLCKCTLLCVDLTTRLNLGKLQELCESRCILLTGGIAHISGRVEEDLRDRKTSLQKPPMSGLAYLVACALSTRCANTGEWMSVLPRKVSDLKSKERYISHFLSNRLIDHLRLTQFACRMILSLRSRDLEQYY